MGLFTKLRMRRRATKNQARYNTDRSILKNLQKKRKSTNFKTQLRLAKAEGKFRRKYGRF